MPKRRKYRQRERASGATAFVIKVGILCCLLFVLNAVACQFVCVFLQSAFPSAFKDFRLVQSIMYFGPIVLICIEFWLYDRRIDYLTKRARNKSETAE